MNRKQRRANKSSASDTAKPSLEPDRAADLFNGGNQFAAAGRLAEAVEAFRAVITARRDFPEAWYHLGHVLATLGRLDDAANAYREAIALRSNYAEPRVNLGNLLAAAGQSDAAIAMLRDAVTVRPDFPEAWYNLGHALAVSGAREDAVEAYRRAAAFRPSFAEAYNNMGEVLVALGRSLDAEAAFRAAIRARADFPEAFYNLGNALTALEREEDAVAAYLRAIELRPRYPEAFNNLAIAFLALDRPAEAVDASRQAVALEPGVAARQVTLGNALQASGRTDEAAAAYQAAIAADPNTPDALIALGNIHLRGGANAVAHDFFRRAHTHRPLDWRKASKAPEFSVLLLITPSIANTPSDYLIGRANYDSTYAMIMDGVEHDRDVLRKSGDVVVNLVADVDYGQAVLPRLIDILDGLSLPAINHPRKILVTGRDAIAERLGGIANCHMPTTVRFSSAALSETTAARSLDRFLFPVLVRPTGSHGGDNLEKLGDAAGVARFVGENPATDYYVTQYVPYESADGLFRKYRLIFVDGEIFPYHLAIDRQWKVHHYRTDMANRADLRAEEEAFVRDPRSIFRPEHWAALKEIHKITDLDYFGIDCALDRDGNLLVFEVNATMLVHNERGIFAYKQPYIARIKRAFDAMLSRRAARK